MRSGFLGKLKLHTYLTPWEEKMRYKCLLSFLRFYVEACMCSSFAEHWNKTKDLFAWRLGVCSDGWCSSLPFSKSRSTSFGSKYSCTFTSSSKLNVSCCVPCLFLWEQNKWGLEGIEKGEKEKKETNKQTKTT